MTRSRVRRAPADEVRCSWKRVSSPESTLFWSGLHFHRRSRSQSTWRTSRDWYSDRETTWTWSMACPIWSCQRSFCGKAHASRTGHCEWVFPDWVTSGAAFKYDYAGLFSPLFAALEEHCQASPWDRSRVPRSIQQYQGDDLRQTKFASAASNSPLIAS